MGIPNEETRMKYYKTVIISILTILALFFLCTCGTEAEQSSAAGVRKAAPGFSIMDVSGNTISLDSLRGKPVFINFFATWCGPCRAEISNFVRLYKKYNSQGFEIIGISLDQGGLSKVKPFVLDHQINYPVALASKEIMSKYTGIAAIPTTVVVDKDGMIDQTIVGSRPGKAFEKMVVRLLEK